MKRENLLQIVDELAREYEGATRLEDGGKALVKLPEVIFPKGCNPISTRALVVLDEQQPAPQLLIEKVPTLANGKTPRSVSATAIAGDPWYSFSFNQRWDENTNSAVQFVEGRLRRFAQNE